MLENAVKYVDSRYIDIHFVIYVHASRRKKLFTLATRCKIIFVLLKEIRYIYNGQGCEVCKLLSIYFGISSA